MINMFKYHQEFLGGLFGKLVKGIFGRVDFVYVYTLYICIYMLRHPLISISTFGEFLSFFSNSDLIENDAFGGP